MDKNNKQKTAFDDKLMVQDKQLELIGESVGRLKELGLEMEKELAQQKELTDDISKRIDNSTTSTQSTINRVKKL